MASLLDLARGIEAARQHAEGGVWASMRRELDELLHDASEPAHKCEREQQAWNVLRDGARLARDMASLGLWTNARVELQRYVPITSEILTPGGREA